MNFAGDRTPYNGGTSTTLNSPTFPDYSKISVNFRRFSKLAKISGNDRRNPKICKEKSENFLPYFFVANFTCERYIFYSVQIGFFFFRKKPSPKTVKH